MLNFATKLNSKDIQKCNCFWVPSYDLFASASKAVFPAPTATGDHRLRNTWLSLLLSWQLVHNYGDNSADNIFLTKSQSSTVPSEKSLDPPPNQKFTDPPLIALCSSDLGKLCQIQPKLTKLYCSVETKRKDSLHLFTVHNKIANTNFSLFTLPCPLPFLFWRSRDEWQAGNAFRSHLLDEGEEGALIYV